MSGRHRWWRQRIGVSALAGLMVWLAMPAWAQETLPILARVGPWPVVSHLIGYQDRLWLANSVKGVNHNSADLYSYDPVSGELRYERHLFSQDAGRPLVADGLLYWPFEDARTSVGFGHFMVTDGTNWQFGTVPSARTFHTHAMAALEGDLIAATSAWRAGFQRSDDGGLTWREIYDHPTADRRVTRIVRLVSLNDLLFGHLISRDDPGLVMLEVERVDHVPGWPHMRPILGLAAFDGAVYGLVREEEGVALWRTDGRGSERVDGPRADWRARALAADDGLWVVTAEDQGGAVWRSADGTLWQEAYRLEGGLPFDLTVDQGGIYVGGTGDDGQGMLWGRPAAPQLAGKTAVLPQRPAIERDWVTAGEELDRILLDPNTYTQRTGRLRNLVFELALAGPPQGFFDQRLSRLMPDDEMSLIGGNVRVQAGKYGRWILLWGMALAGHGQVPPALLAEPWTEPANGAEKYFEAAPAAMWTVALTGQQDRAAIDALIGRLAYEDDPMWLRGDAIGALSAVTGQRFGYDVAAWQNWWREARPNWPD